MTRTKLSIAEVSRLLQLYDPNTNMNINDNQKRSILSKILTQIGFYGQRNNVNAVEQAIKAVVSRNLYLKQSNAATVIQQRVRKWFNQREQQRQNEQIQLEQRQQQLEQQRQQDIQELRQEFDADVLDEEGIFDTEKYRNKQHQLRRDEQNIRRNEQDQRNGMEKEDQQAKHRNFIEELHNVPDMDIDILFETNQYEISDYIRVHEKYKYHQVDAENDVIMLCDAQNEEQFNRIKNQALSRQRGQVFKLAVDFGVIIERVDGNAESQIIKYKYLLPIDANSERRVPLEIRSEHSISLYKQYLRTVQLFLHQSNTSKEERFIMLIAK
ncbi:MAG: hypothetical protein EZS28_043123 [Streblomastix strix]|uniref:Uncharacterized protein n=1 Tax=Streblomastix strix TaxID=222440 RepID=A0A5J4TUW0_9EUKA|nr:MAG: hypothetical protein EZS28_043123 [Streblomastix strix]